MGVIFLGQGFLTDDSLHSSGILGCCVVGVELVGHRCVIFSVLLNSFLHQTGERRKHVNGRINLLVVELPVDKDLSFSDVACKIGNGMSDIVVLR